MRRRNSALFFFFCGLLSFAALPLIYRFEKAFFQKREPFFVCPVPSQYNQIHLRHDGYGKGHFGASRNGGRTHQGIDLLTQVGEPVFASKSGRIEFAGGNEKGYGQYIEIIHPDGFRTLYAHLSAIDVRHQDWVKQGEAIGKAGKSGNAKNRNILPHLHFEIKEKRKPINPASFINFKLI